MRLLIWLLLLHFVASQFEDDCVTEPLPSTHSCFDSFDPLSPRGREVVFCWRSCLDQIAEGTLKLLRTYKLNVVTAESLTAGMIASTLVDISPGYGAYVYGGFAVYDTDAKRQFLGVTADDVYTERCAREMAAGALNNSRAVVSIAVTGNAGPVRNESLSSLGEVDIAASLRTSVSPPGTPSASGPFVTKWRRASFCAGDGSNVTSTWCERYKTEASSDEAGRATAATVSATRRLLRSETVAAALSLLSQHIQENCANGGCDDIAAPSADYDGVYSGEPSYIISERS